MYAVRLVDGEPDHSAGYVQFDGYTLPLLADGLGKSYLSVKAWIDSGVLPPPVWAEYSRGFKVYTTPEVQAIARVLHAHSHEFTYLSRRMSRTVSRIWSAVDRTRRLNLL